jgi:ubiquinone/menaquinone biosynthesis C-methylase UbiE
MYDRYLAPLLFEPYAEEVAERAKTLGPRRILETAAGTGIVTEALNRALPDTKIVATDLNPDMLSVAAQRVRSPRVSFQTADALELPFEDRTFDLVVCQFGAMFFPDKMRANVEVRRVLRDGGAYMPVIWDSIARNLVCMIVEEAVADLYPGDPPRFLSRAPYGYSDPAAIEVDMRSAGFSQIHIDAVQLKSRPVSPRDAAFGLINGCPLGAEIAERDRAGTDEAVCAATEALRRIERDGALDSTLSAHVITATR